MSQVTFLSLSLSLSSGDISVLVSQDPAGPSGAFGGILIFRDTIPGIRRLWRCLKLREHLLDVALTLHMRQYAEVMDLSLCECEARDWVVVGQVAILLSFDAVRA